MAAGVQSMRGLSAVPKPGQSTATVVSRCARQACSDAISWRVAIDDTADNNSATGPVPHQVAAQSTRRPCQGHVKKASRDGFIAACGPADCCSISAYPGLRLRSQSRKAPYGFWLDRALQSGHTLPIAGRRVGIALAQRCP